MKINYDYNVKQALIFNFSRMSKKTVIIIVIGLLLLCCCSATAIGTIALIFSEDSIDEIKNEIEEEVESMEDELDTDTDTDNETDSDSDNDSDDLEETNDPLTYSNSEYGFSLELAEGWEKYRVVETLDTTDSYVADYSFELKDNTGDYVSLFTIFIYTPEQWSIMEDLGVPEWTGEEEIGTSGNYVYTFSHLNGFPPTELEDEFDDVDQIKNSFEVGANKK